MKKIIIVITIIVLVTMLIPSKSKALTRCIQIDDILIVNYGSNWYYYKPFKGIKEVGGSSITKITLEANYKVTVKGYMGNINSDSQRIIYIWGPTRDESYMPGKDLWKVLRRSNVTPKNTNFSYTLDFTPEVSSGFLNTSNNVLLFSFIPIIQDNPSEAWIYDDYQCITLPQSWLQGQAGPTVEGELTDYNCITNTAKFSIAANFSLTNVYDVKTVTDLNNETIAGYSFDTNTWILTVNFKQKIQEYVNPKAITFTADGTDPNTGQSITGIQGSISFEINCLENPEIKDKEFKIIEPPNGSTYETGTSQIFVEAAYGGDIVADYPNGYTFEVSIVAMKGFKNYGSFVTTSYTISNNATFWSGNLNFNPVEDGAYEITATLVVYDTSNSILAMNMDTITITIGKSSGNPLIDFLLWLWNEFKKWFVDIMKYLFIPSSSDISKLLANGWIQVENPIQRPTLRKSITIPAFWTETKKAEIDFSSIQSWNGYNAYLTIARLALWVLLIFLVWSVLI